jgi:hypothetical protein
MLKLRHIFTGNLQVNGKPEQCFLEISYNFENEEYPVDLAIQKNTGDPIIVNGMNLDTNIYKLGKFGLDIFSCGLKNDVTFTENTIKFNIKDYTGSVGFLRNIDSNSYEFRIDDCCLDKFHKFIILRKKINI